MSSKILRSKLRVLFNKPFTSQEGSRQMHDYVKTGLTEFCANQAYRGSNRHWSNKTVVVISSIREWSNKIIVDS